MVGERPRFASLRHLVVAADYATDVRAAARLHTIPAPDAPPEARSMTRSVHVFQVDAFTDQRFTGNPAGVVLGADVLADDEMLAIARELNNADTAFVLKPDGPDHDLRVRFFTPRTEASFVGHATVAAQYVLSRRDGTPARLRQKQKSGSVDIEVRGTGPRGGVVWEPLADRAARTEQIPLVPAPSRSRRRRGAPPLPDDPVDGSDADDDEDPPDDGTDGQLALL